MLITMGFNHSTLPYSNGNIEIWDIESGELINKRYLDKDGVINSVFSPDFRTVVTIGNSTKIWDVESNYKLVQTLEFYC